MGHVPVRLHLQGLYGPLPMSDVSSYPVTPLAAFGLSDAFDNWNAINAQNLDEPVQAGPMPKHAGMKPSGWQVDGRGLGPRLVHNPSGPQQTPTDNAEAASTCAVSHFHR